MTRANTYGRRQQILRDPIIKLTPRLAVITTHPIQYYAPWFAWIAGHSDAQLKVFYLWDRSQSGSRDPGFACAVDWDLPLLEGYQYEFVENTSRHPGSDRFWGIQNRQALRMLKSWNPYALLLIGYRYATMMRLIASHSVPLIFRGDSHRLDIKADTLKAQARAIVISTIYRRFSAVTYVGQANREYFKLHGVPDEKLFFAPHAIDNDRFIGEADSGAREQGMQWRRTFGIPDDHLLILFAGKFELKKRPFDLLAAVRRLKGGGERSAAANRLGISLLFVGNGALEAELRAAAANVLNVYFAPFQNQSKMPRTYAACDLFVLPSYGQEESWGLAVNEALCMSKPVIVSSHVGCAADLVHDNVNGRVFEAGDVDALTAALQDAVADPERLKWWGAAGREIVRNFDYAHATEGLLRAFDWAVTNGTGGNRRNSHRLQR